MSTLTAPNTSLYWNVFRNSLSGMGGTTIPTLDSDDAIFGLQADPRYVTYLEQYLATDPSIPESEKQHLLENARASHDAATSIIGGAPDAEMLAGIQSLYAAIETGDTATLGALAINPSFEPAGPGIDATETGALPPTEEIHAPLHIVVGGGTYVQWPVNGSIVNTFTEENKGVDIRVAANTQVASISDGTVIYADNHETLGNLVIVRHNESHYAAYSNLGEINVEKDDVLTRGQPLGVMTNPDDLLHFEMRMGPDRAAIDPEEALGPITAAAEPTPGYTDYAVQDGDNLWTIAQNHYGLTDPTEIQNAVTHIANANGMTEGVMANYLRGPDPDKPDEAQIIRLPDAAILPTEPAIALDWAALDNDIKHGMLQRGNFSAIDGGQPIIFSRLAEGDEEAITLGVRGNLSRTIQEAASQFDVDLTLSQAYALSARIAEANGIEDANVVQAGQQVRFTRDMFGAAAPA